MLLLHYLIEIPLIFFTIWCVANTDISGSDLSFALWPFDSALQINVKLALCCFLFLGYVWAKINSWFNYSPLRCELKQQRKANKSLNKEQEKLNQTVSGLQKNIVGLQEKAKLQEAKYRADCPKKSLLQKISEWLEKVQQPEKSKEEK